MNRDLTHNRPTRYEFFVLVSMTGIVCYFVYALLAGAKAFDWLIMNNSGGWQFGDFFQHMIFMQDAKHIYANISGVWGSFPPLNYVFYYLLHTLTARSDKALTNIVEYELSHYTMLVFLFYTILLTLAFLYAVKQWNKQAHYRRMFLCLLFSTPFFAGVYERGNSVMTVLVLLLIALNWRDSSSKVKRELAMLLIAVCAGIKIYPAIFGLLYIKEKRWKEAIRLVLYGLILFFGPFLFFLGRNGFILWFSNIVEAFKVECVGRVEFIKGLFCTSSFLITVEANEAIGSAVSILFLLIMVFLSILSSSRNRTVFFLCAAMVFFPSNAFRYTLCYLSIPLVIDLMEHGDELIKPNLLTLETFLYGLVFTIPTYMGAVTLFRLNFNNDYPRATYVEVWIYLMAYFLVAVVIMHELYFALKHKNFNPY